MDSEARAASLKTGASFPDGQIEFTMRQLPTAD
jgi:hypothetical protein